MLAGLGKNHSLRRAEAHHGFVGVQLQRRFFLRATRLPVDAAIDGAFQSARLVVPMRLHALILARLVGCPIAALSYDPKVAAAAQMSGVPCTDLTSWLSTEGLLAQWRGCVDRPADAAQLRLLQGQASEHARLFSRG